MSISYRNRTSKFCIMYALYLYFLGLSFRNTSKAIEPFEERSHVAIWKWVQRFGPSRIYVKKRVAAFVIDETMIQIGNDKIIIQNEQPTDVPYSEIITTSLFCDNIFTNWRMEGGLQNW